MQLWLELRCELVTVLQAAIRRHLAARLDRNNATDGHWHKYGQQLAGLDMARPVENGHLWQRAAGVCRCRSEVTLEMERAAPRWRRRAQRGGGVEAAQQPL